MTTKVPTWPTDGECQQVMLALRGKDVDRLTLRAAMHSPWLEVKVWVHMEGDYELALWRATGAVYELDSLGAVKDDPMIPGAWEI